MAENTNTGQPGNAPRFRYKKGSTEIEGDAGNRHLIRLAYFETIVYWLLRVIIVVSGGATVKLLIKLPDTG